MRADAIDLPLELVVSKKRVPHLSFLRRGAPERSENAPSKNATRVAPGPGQAVWLSRGPCTPKR